MSDEHHQPEWYKVASEELDGTHAQVLTMSYRGKIFRARAMQLKYPYFRWASQGDHAWFEGWTGIEGDDWVRLPELPATH